MSAVKGEEDAPNMDLNDIIDGANERGLPKAKFIEDVTAFSTSFQPPASAELLIGAYNELLSKYRSFETQLKQKQERFAAKVPELNKSLTLVQTLLKKKNDTEAGVVRYSLADNIFAKAEIDFSVGTVNLWLGANVMLEFTYEEAIEFLTKNYDKANREMEESKQDLAFVQDQIVTSEVTMSRIFNWDVRKKREAQS